MTATLLVRSRERHRPDTFTEIVIWQLPRQLPGSAHGYKYRMALVSNAVCVLRYDNEAGKGDHRHIGPDELPYRFTTIERLLEDFDTDTRRWLDAHPDHR